jgi:hypothetical protein
MDNFAFFGFAFVIVKSKAKNSNTKNGFKFVAPFAFFRLFSDWKCRIVDGSVLEEILFSFLEFNNKFFAGQRFAIDVKKRFPVG